MDRSRSSGEVWRRTISLPFKKDDPLTEQGKKRRAPPIRLYVAIGLLILMAPVFFVRQWKVSKRPVVLAMASAQHVVSKGKGGQIVIGTVEFDRPDKSGQFVHCKVDDQWLGDQSDHHAYDGLIQLAVRTDSCYDAVRVP